MGKKCICGIQCVLIVSLITVAGCKQHSYDVSTAVTLAKTKLKEYGEIQQQIRTFRGDPTKQNYVKEQELTKDTLLNDALHLLEQVNVRRSGKIEWILVYVDVLEKKGDYDLAVEVLEELLKTEPMLGEGWVRLGENYYRMGEKWFEKAFLCFERAKRMELSEEMQLRVWRICGDIFWSLRQFEPSEESYKKALEHGGDIWSKVGLAGISVVRGKMTEAEKRLIDIGKELKDWDVAVRLRMREALSFFEELTKEVPETDEEITAYGHLLYRAGRVEDAMAVMNYSLMLNPEQWKEWNFLGNMYLQLGYYRDAEDAYTTSLKYNPEQQDVKKVLEDITNLRQRKVDTGKSSQPLIFKNN